MIILQIEHPVKDYAGWKNVFDKDPMDRKGSGVKRYSIYRAADDPFLVFIIMEMNSLEEASVLLEKLKVLWKNLDGRLIDRPKGTIIQLVETKFL